ncbi:MAG: hypothetical protein Q9216_004010 [Gyalolechia sp. 2 TL-2023]
MGAFLLLSFKSAGTSVPTIWYPYRNHDKFRPDGKHVLKEGQANKKMVKPLTFKGDKKTKKRKAPLAEKGHWIEQSTQDRTVEAQEDDSWVTADTSGDVNGPVVIVLPSKKPACIACDAGGKVFVSELENMIEGDPATAEPHDVRQVWIATNIAGTDNVSFKSYHKSIGMLSARTEAMSPEETFTCIASTNTPGTFNIQTEWQMSITVTEDGKEVRGDTDSSGFNSTVRIRMHARFKPNLKASKELKAKEKVSKKELEEVVGRRLDDDEIRKLKKARVKGDFHEAILDVRVKGKHDKYS